MTDTTPDYAGLIGLLNALAVDHECDEEHDAKETCDKSAEAIRTLLDRNAALERERDQLWDKLHCMCGSPIDHSAWEGHTPVSVYDYSLDQERSRAEAAETRVKALEALMHKAHAVMRECGWQLAISAEPQGDGILEAACTEVEADFADALSARALEAQGGQSDA